MTLKISKNIDKQFFLIFFMVIRQGGVSKERDDEGKRKKEKPKGALAVE
jgi:hypothetical protein